MKKDPLKVFTDLESGELSKLDSSNPNESFNNTVWSKALQDKHYSESGSLAHRLSAAVCQKNEGYKYVAQLQCLKLKSQRSSETRSHEIRKGDTYCSNVIVIPGPSEDNCEHIAKVVVFYDLKTTGLSRQSSITQISAVSEKLEFNRYATPTQEISEDASRVTGIRFNTATNELLYNDEPVSNKHPQQVLLDFIQFLMSLCASDKTIVLTAHNNRRFDSIILTHQVTAHGVQPNVESLEHLLKNKVLSRTILKKLEDSSLSYNHLKIAYHRDGFDGLFYLLSEKTDSGKARISNNRRVIQKLADFFLMKNDFITVYTCIDK
ncbi:unnamed protein product [Mytilus coruscus]|uniref:PML C-terminal domain-containing protein n=1 Tax=Mytilus coruscus TaxID=42192 RepID=A0A6J8A2D3_MYTCO|nr:unnamed protein product [Mytilus coruscus]